MQDSSWLEYPIRSFCCILLKQRTLSVLLWCSSMDCVWQRTNNVPFPDRWWAWRTVGIAWWGRYFFQARVWSYFSKGDGFLSFFLHTMSTRTKRSSNGRIMFLNHFHDADNFAANIGMVKETNSPFFMAFILLRALIVTDIIPWAMPLSFKLFKNIARISSANEPWFSLRFIPFVAGGVEKFDRERLL